MNTRVIASPCPSCGEMLVCGVDWDEGGPQFDTDRVIKTCPCDVPEDELLDALQLMEWLLAQLLRGDSCTTENYLAMSIATMIPPTEEQSNAEDV